MEFEEEAPLPKKEIVILRKRKRREESSAKQYANKLRATIKRKGAKPLPPFKSMSKIVADCRRVKTDQQRLKGSKKVFLSIREDGDDEKPKLGIAVRIAANLPLAGDTKLALKSLRLDSFNRAALFKLNQQNKRFVAMAEPYIAWGYPNQKTVRELVFKRGCGHIETEGTSRKKTVPLTDNTKIEDNLGNIGVICLEDVVHELTHGGDHFEDVNDFLYNFKLNNPEKVNNKKMVHSSQGGAHGFFGDQVNTLIQSMI